jgi:hypothetical protein
VNEFLHRQAVSYTWSVVPVAQLDFYSIQLLADFQTAVPMPVVTVDQPLVMAFVRPDMTTTFNLTYTNHGLIDAINLKFSALSDANFVATPLIDHLDVLPAMSSITIPFTLAFKSDAPALTAGASATSAGGSVTPQNQSGNASAALSCLGIDADYTYICANAQTVSVSSALNVIGCIEDATSRCGSSSECDQGQSDWSWLRGNGSTEPSLTCRTR